MRITNNDNYSFALNVEILMDTSLARNNFKAMSIKISKSAQQDLLEIVFFTNMSKYTLKNHHDTQFWNYTSQ